MHDRTQKPGIFYGWILVACGVLVLGVTHGVVINCFSLFIIPVSSRMNVSREAFSICLSIINALYALVSVTSGAIYKRFNVHTLMKISAVLLPCAWIGFGFCNSMPTFYGCAALAGIGISFLTFLPWTQIISNWFVEKRGTALGLCFMGTGLGGTVFNILTALLIEGSGPQAAYRVIGAVMLVLLVPIVFFVVRIRPEDMGIKAMGATDDTASQTAALQGPMLRDALKTPSFWALLLLALIIGLDSTVAGAIIAPHLCDLGFSALYASGIVSAYLAALAVIKVVHGRLYDKVGAKWGTIVSMAGFILGFLGLYLAGASWAHWLILTVALGTSSSNVSYPITTHYAFGNRDYTAIYGVMMGMNFVTCSIGAVMANSIYSATGSYNTMILICIALAAVAMLLMPVVRPCKPEKQ